MEGQATEEANDNIETAEKGDLFEDVTFYLSPSLPPDVSAGLRSVMVANGGTPLERDAFHKATHIISCSDTLESLEQDPKKSKCAGQVIVTPEWVISAIYTQWLPNPKYFSTDPRLLFSGVIATSESLPPSDTESLAAGIMGLGGQWRSGLTRDVTHLFTLIPDGNKYNSALSFFKVIQHPLIVTPHWFDDSLKCQRLQPVDKYLFPDPPILQPNFSVSTLAAQGEYDPALAERLAVLANGANGTIPRPRKRTAQERERAKQNAAIKQSVSYAEGQKTPTAKIGRRVWEGRRVRLSGQLGLEHQRRETVEREISLGGGQPVVGDRKFPKDYDILVTSSADGEEYEEAVQAGKIIGTIAWVFYVITSGILSAPEDHFLHYPVRPGGVADFAGITITVTNYSGEAREYIKALISRLGGDFTPSQTPETRICIAATKAGAKAGKAAEWGIPVVNHIWLEDCFEQWRWIQPSSEEGRYIHYPPGVDWAEVLGQRGVGRTHRGIPPSTDVQRNGSSEGLHITESIQHGVFTKSSTPSIHDHAPGDTDTTHYMPEIHPQSAAGEDASPTELYTNADPGDHILPAMEGVVQSAALDPAESEGAMSDVEMVEAAVQDKSSERSPSRSPLRNKHTARYRKQVVVDLDDSEDDEPLPTAEDVFQSSLKPKVSAPDSSPIQPQQIERLSSYISDAEIVVPSPRKKARVSSTRKSHGTAGPSGKSSSLSPPPSSAPKPAPVDDGHNRSGRKAKTPARSKRPSRQDTSPMEVDDASDDVNVDFFAPTPSRRAARVAPPSSSRLQRVSVPERAPDSSPIDGLPQRSQRAAAGKAKNMLSSQMQDANHYAAEKRAGKGDVHHFKVAGQLGKRRREGSRPEDEDSGPEGTEEDDTPAPERRNRSGRSGEAPRASSSKRKGKEKDEEDVSESEEEEREALKAPKKKPSRPSTQTKPKASDSDAEPRPTQAKSKTVANRLPKSDSKKTRIMFTKAGFDEKEKNTIIRKLTKLGVQFTEDPTKCTHVVSPVVSRTEKFVRAVARSPMFVTPKWVKDSAAAGKLLDESNYLLVDPDNEKKYHFSLAEALERAQDGKVFSGLSFVATPGIKLSFETLNSIVKGAGGTITQTKTPQARTLLNTDKRYLISCAEDEAIWKPLAKQGIPIYAFGLLLNAALTQYIDWDGTIEPVRLDV